MEENKQGYDPSEFEDDDYMASQPVPEKSIRGYRIVIIILSVILVALSVLYFSIHRQQMVDNQLLQADRDSIQNDLGRLMTDYDNLQVTNDSISANLNVERDRADSLMTRLKKAAELDNKVRVGAVIRARDIRLSALNANSKPVSRIKNAARLRVDFVLTANELATPGEKTVYVRITSPDGYVLTTEAMPTFDFEGERLSYSAMREVDYQNQDLEVGIYYNSTGFAAGAYTVQLFCDGRLIGTSQIAMR